MKSPSIVHFLVLWIFLNSPLVAQEILENERIFELSNINAVQLNLTSNESFAIIQQLGDENDASILQIPQVLKADNFSQILQYGNNNVSRINQQGSNLIVLNSQDGSNNISGIVSNGDNISISTKQTGERNSISAIVENTGYWSRFVLLEQSGKDNKINLEFSKGTSYLSTDYSGESVRISQTGNQHSLNLSLYNSNASVNITQTPGTGGLGMQVNLHTSAFP